MNILAPVWSPVRNILRISISGCVLDARCSAAHVRCACAVSRKTLGLAEDVKHKNMLTSYLTRAGPKDIWAPILDFRICPAEIERLPS